MADNRFIGSGIIFPVELEKGAPVVRTGADLVESSIKIILAWPIRERFFLPEFGSRIEELLEEPNDDILISLVSLFIVESLRQWEPRIRLTDVKVQRSGVEPHRLNCDINYTILTSGQERSFIYPFYTNRLI